MLTCVCKRNSNSEISGNSNREIIKSSNLTVIKHVQSTVSDSPDFKIVSSGLSKRFFGSFLLLVKFIYFEKNPKCDKISKLVFTLLRPSRNKKCLNFVGMLVFGILFLNFNQLPPAKKRIQKTRIPTNLRPFLFCEGFK